jgi:hypothetical protein
MQRRFSRDDVFKGDIKGLYVVQEFQFQIP